MKPGRMTRFLLRDCDKTKYALMELVFLRRDSDQGIVPFDVELFKISIDSEQSDKCREAVSVGYSNHDDPVVRVPVLFDDAKKTQIDVGPTDKKERIYQLSVKNDLKKKPETRQYEEVFAMYYVDNQILEKRNRLGAGCNIKPKDLFDIIEPEKKRSNTTELV